MYPNNNPFNPQPAQQPTGIDYLNQIATPPPAEGFDKKTKIILIILGVVGALALIFIFIMAQQTTPQTKPTHVAARLQKLLTVSKKYNDKLQYSTLQATNASLVSVLTTANASMVGPMKNAKVDVAKQAKELVALDPSTKLETKLDDAMLNAQLDIVYAHEMNVQLTDTISMMQKMAKTTKSTSMKDFLNKTVDDLENIQKQIAEIIKS